MSQKVEELKDKVESETMYKMRKSCPICGGYLGKGILSAAYLPEQDWWLIKHLVPDGDGGYNCRCQQAGWQFCTKVELYKQESK